MPYSLPHYAVIRDGNVVARCESFMLARESFMGQLEENGFLELTLQNTRAIITMAGRITQSETKEMVV